MTPTFSGFGLGLRKPHYGDFLEHRIAVDFLEVISENFMVDGGRPRQILRDIRARYPVALHGVSMSLGSADGVDGAYLARLRALVDEVEPLFISGWRASMRTTCCHCLIRRKHSTSSAPISTARRKRSAASC